MSVCDVELVDSYVGPFSLSVGRPLRLYQWRGREGGVGGIPWGGTNGGGVEC